MVPWWLSKCLGRVSSAYVREDRLQLERSRSEVRFVDMAASALPRHSIYPTAGREGKAIDKNSYTGSTIAVFTSGGDAQGTHTQMMQLSGMWSRSRRLGLETVSTY